MTFAEERIADVWDEMQGLVTDHVLATRQHGWPQRSAYEAMPLTFYTMRDADRVLRGYGVFIVLVHPQTGLLEAIQDALYIAPEARGHAGGKFLLWIESQIIATGAVKLTWMMPNGHNGSWLYRLGYDMEYMAFSRSL